MTQPRPDHIAPPPGVLRRVLIGYAVAIGALIAAWGWWALEAERRLAAVGPSFAICCATFGAGDASNGAESRMREWRGAIRDATGARLVDDPWVWVVDGHETEMLAHNQTAIDSLRDAARSPFCGAIAGAPDPEWAEDEHRLRLWILSLTNAARVSGDDALALAIIHDTWLLGERTRHWNCAPNELSDTLSDAAIEAISHNAPTMPVTAQTRPLIRALIADLTHPPGGEADALIRSEVLRVLNEDDANLRVTSRNSPLAAIIGLGLRPMRQLGRWRAAQRWLEMETKLEAHTVYTTVGKLNKTQPPAHSLRRFATSPGRHLTPDMSRMMRAYSVIRERRLAALTLAIRLFEADNGYYPPSLRKLTPAYLVDVPRNPFGRYYFGRPPSAYVDGPEPTWDPRTIQIWKNYPVIEPSSPSALAEPNDPNKRPEREPTRLLTPEEPP